MKSDEIEEGSPCPFCGVIAIVFDGAADITCPSCGAELINISVDDYVDGDDLDLLDSEIDSDDFGSSDEGDF
ncbi:MAG: hypothetical protein NTW88_05380 [Actinobacteria bacterium]|nr:hypothetical protein [Actinomycetota bacterium]